MQYVRTSLAAVTALAGSMLLAPVPGSAQSGIPAVKSDFGDPVITLVAGGPSGHAGAMVQGGGSRGFAGPRSNGPRFAKGREDGRFEHSDRGRFAEGRESGERFEHRDRRFTERGDRDFDHHRHGHFVNGGWIWDFGPDYYAYDYYGGNCWWLQRRAAATGNPYWWERYRDCVGYY
jgi:hypothetical protein